jgi:hypothetical protein
MNRAALLNEDWQIVVDRLGGAAAIEASARETKAFVRPRGIASAVDLLRMTLAYCLGEGGLRSTAAWAAAVGLADISNVALLYRLWNCGDWLAALVGRALQTGAPEAGRGRLIRLVDATTVPQAGVAGRQRNGLWRIHSAFELPAERFGFFALTNQAEGERFDRIPVVNGEIRIADRAYLQPNRIASVLAAGGDIVVRAGWKGARWRDAEGAPLDLMAALRDAAERGLVDRPIRVHRRGGDPLPLRLVALRKSPTAAEAARRKARREAQKGGHQIARETIEAADWVILLTSLPQEAFATADILALYRLRWRIELAFKRLKTLVGLNGPPGADERSARPYVLAHLLMILLLEPLVDAFEDSPRSAAA